MISSEPSYIYYLTTLGFKSQPPSEIGSNPRLYFSSEKSLNCFFEGPLLIFVSFKGRYVSVKSYHLWSKIYLSLPPVRLKYAWFVKLTIVDLWSLGSKCHASWITLIVSFKTLYVHLATIEHGYPSSMSSLTIYSTASLPVLLSNVHILSLSPTIPPCNAFGPLLTASL